MKKNPHVIWVCPTSETFFRAKGEVRCRPGSVIPRLSEHGFKIDVLIPHDPTLLPKTKLSSARITRHTIHLGQDYPIEIIKLSRGSLSPGLYMLKMPGLEPALHSAVLSRSALALAKQIKRPVDIFHMFEWESALLPLFLELDRNGSRLLKESRTFLSIHSLRDQGNFAPGVLTHLGLPKTLFHPAGIEFFGKVSFLKSGLLFSDGVSLIEGGMALRNHVHRNGTGLEGVLDEQAHKLRRWVSERSLRSYLDAYGELLSMPSPRPVLPRLMEKCHIDEKQYDRFIESWGPLPPDSYNQNCLSFLIQSPTKAFGFWEWTHNGFTDYGLVLENRSDGSRRVLSRGLNALGDFWIDVLPDRPYVLELVGWTKSNEMVPLLRSRIVRTPRNIPSANKDAVFIDVRTRRRFLKKGVGWWNNGQLFSGSSASLSALDWMSGGLPSSLKEGTLK